MSLQDIRKVSQKTSPTPGCLLLFCKVLEIHKNHQQILFSCTKNTPRSMTLATALLTPALARRGGGVAHLALRQIRGYSTPRAKESSLSTARSGQHEVSADVKPLGERIKENTKTASYTGVILLGVGVTGALFYTIFRELFSSSSPNSVYSAALDKCINDPRVQDALGAPIKGYGEESSRRRRRHVAHSVYQRDGVNHMRMQFYVQGIRNKATVHLEMKENSAGSYDYRYMFAQLDHYPKTTIILEDNRDPQKNAPLPSLY